MPCGFANDPELAVRVPCGLPPYALPQHLPDPGGQSQPLLSGDPLELVEFVIIEQDLKSHTHVLSII